MKNTQAVMLLNKPWSFINDKIIFALNDVGKM